MSTKKEQAALVAFFNSFGLSKRVTNFDQLNDGKALLERCGAFQVDTGSSLDIRRELGAEDEYPVIAQSYASPESTKGLLQICRMCLSAAVWAPGNEKVIAKIQSLGEAHMAELMKSIEGIMATMPTNHGDSAPSSSTDRSCQDVSPPPSGLRAERDKLLKENDQLRQKCETLVSQISKLSGNLEEAIVEKDELLSRTRNEPSTNLRTSQAASSEIESLRADLATAEENLAKTESALENQLAAARDLSRQVDEFRQKAEQAGKLKDQLDEYRHAAEKLQKSENVIEKYKKKLEDSAALRRELRTLEAENATLSETNTKLEAELRKAGSMKALLDQYRSEITALETREAEQDEEITNLRHQLEDALAELQERDQALHDREGDGATYLGPDRSMSEDELDHPGNTSLGDELATSAATSAAETKAALKDQIQALQGELTRLKATRTGNDDSDLSGLLADANSARNRYQADYHEALRNNLRLQASLNALQSAKGTDTENAANLEQRIEEMEEERKGLLNAQRMGTEAMARLQSELESAHLELSLIDKGDRDRIASLRKSLSTESDSLKVQLDRLQGEMDVLKEKNRAHLQEIKELLMDKVGLQSDGISQRELALEREKEFNDLRNDLSNGNVDPEVQARVLQLDSINVELAKEVTTLSDKLEKAKDFIRNQDALFRAEYGSRSKGDFENAQKSHEAQLSALKAELLKARQASAAVEQRYKLEQQLMLSAWHDLGSRIVGDHLHTAGQRRTTQRPVPTSWLGKQRRYQEEATFSR